MIALKMFHSVYLPIMYQWILVLCGFTAVYQISEEYITNDTTLHFGHQTVLEQEKHLKAQYALETHLDQNGNISNMGQTNDNAIPIILLSNLGVRVSNKYDDFSESRCSVEMFGGDSNAYWACVTEYALQTNWFPSPIAGLYYRQYLDWNGFDGFWQNGAVLETLVNYMHYTSSKRYNSIFKIAGRTVDQLILPLPSFDDDGWYAVSFLRIYEVTGNITYLTLGEDMYNWLYSNGWDTSMTCSGGMWFGNGHGKKITITNAQMLVLGAKLYRYRKDHKYLHQALLQFDYLKTQVINSTSFLVADSISPYDPNCLPLAKFNVSYNTGMIIGGLVELYKATGNHSYIELAHNMTQALINNNDHNGVLLEYCDWDSQCANDLDAQMFKGIFARNVRYLMDVSDDKYRRFYKNWLQDNVNSVLANGQCLDDIKNCKVMFLDGPSKYPTQGPLFTTSWVGPYNLSNVISQTSVLDLFTSAIGPDTVCRDTPDMPRGKGCNFDPPIPDIESMACEENPCPKGHACCSWAAGYATCCTSDQHCYSGGCY